MHVDHGPCRHSGSLASLLLLAASGGALAHAAHEQTPAERAIEYRQSVYHLIAWNFAPLSAALQGKAPYDKDAFALAASRIAALAPMLPEGFPAGSYVAGKTDAKPELWQDPAEFARLMKDLATRSAALAEIARSGDLDQIRPAFEDLAKACKACHKKFRAE
jgi:cytochrome c556